MNTIKQLLKLGKMDVARAKYQEMWDNCCELDRPYVGTAVRQPRAANGIDPDCA